jgi:hypothetical protein
MHTKFSSENMNGKDHLGDLDVDGTVILKLILNSVRVYELDSSSFFDHCNEHVGSIKDQ